MIIGIDNGLDGGIVAISPIYGVAPIAKIVMPTRQVTYPARKNSAAKVVREVDFRALWIAIQSLEPKPESTTVYFEHCPFRAERASTMRSMALSAGKILGVLEGLKLKTVRILHLDWHPVMLGSFPKGQSKPTAAAEVERLWPGENWFATDRSTTVHTGLVDAALIAEYGRRLTHPHTVPISEIPDALPWE